jgi:large subunit ribosomal protein L6
MHIKMSRIGKLPVELPAGVKASITHSSVTVEGQTGKLLVRIPSGISVKQEGTQLIVVKTENSKQAQCNYGTVRSHISNAVDGITKGWEKKLELNGVGFGAKVKDNQVILSVGFSHEVVMQIPAGVTVNLPAKNSITLQSIDKEVVNNFAAILRLVQRPEPYLGKGIKYAGEIIRRKAGKTGKK